MKVGILSDTHNHSQTVLKILNHFRTEHINTVFHCGDVSSPELIKAFDGFTLHLAFGNCDYLTGAIQEQILLLGTNSTCKRINTPELASHKIAIVHGNYPRELKSLIEDQNYDFIFTGHTHNQEQNRHDNTWIINPGAASAKGNPSYAYAIMDFEKSDLKFYHLDS